MIWVWRRLGATSAVLAARVVRRSAAVVWSAALLRRVLLALSWLLAVDGQWASFGDSLMLRWMICSRSFGICPRHICLCRSRCQSSIRRRLPSSAMRSPRTIPTQSCSRQLSSRSTRRSSGLASHAQRSPNRKPGRSMSSSRTPRSWTWGAIRGGSFEPVCCRPWPCESAPQEHRLAFCSPPRSRPTHELSSGGGSRRSAADQASSSSGPPRRLPSAIASAIRSRPMSACGRTSLLRIAT